MCAPRPAARDRAHRSPDAPVADGPSAADPSAGAPAQSRPGAFGRRGFLAAGLGGLGGLTLAACGIGSEQAGPGASSASGSAGSPGGTSATQGGTGGQAAVAPTSAGTLDPSARPAAADLAARATVPVLCYHQVRPWAGDDSGYTRQLLVIPPENLAAQLDAIKGGGYTTISPQQYREHLFSGAQLPAKPVIISFDDGKDNQVSAALPALTQRGMTATFFIMTVILGNPGWMKRDDVKRLADAGMTIGSHTWDHHMVTKYSGKDYAVQLEQPRELLRTLSGQSVDDFAYPYGAWNAAILPHLRTAGYQAAYQLQDKPKDATHPELTLRRILTPSQWSGQQLLAKLGAFA